MAFKWYDPRPSKTVVKSNRLIESSYRLSITEKKIIEVLASAIHKDDEDFKDYTFSIKDFIELSGVKNQSKYEDVRTAAEGLVQNTFTFREKNAVTTVAWLSGCRYYEHEGLITLQFSPWLKPYLLQLKGHFTQYQLGNIMQIKSSYAIRIYELLKQRQKIGYREFTVDELRHILQIDEQYKNYKDFRRNVILVAQKELKEKTDICFTFEETRLGRKVASIYFTIESNTKINEHSLFDPKYQKAIKQIKSAQHEIAATKTKGNPGCPECQGKVKWPVWAEGHEGDPAWQTWITCSRCTHPTKS